MKKVVREIIEAMVIAKTQEDINKVCAMIDRAYQSEKITFADNELLYKMIAKIS